MKTLVLGCDPRAVEAVLPGIAERLHTEVVGTAMVTDLTAKQLEGITHVVIFPFGSEQKTGNPDPIIVRIAGVEDDFDWDPEADTDLYSGE